MHFYGLVGSCPSSAGSRRPIAVGQPVATGSITRVTNFTHAEDLALAQALADRAAELAFARYRVSDLQIETKADASPVSESDKGIELALREVLARERPDDAIVGEEFGGIDAWRETPGRSWTIDPIDGTESYVRGLDTWGTLIALTVGGEVELGLVSMPPLGKRWWATRGDGAFGTSVWYPEPRPLHVSTISALANAQLIWSGIQEWDAIGGVEPLIRLGRACHRTRGIGDIWQYMLVAEGVAELATDPEVKLWDVAAASLIVTEAGGRFTALDGTPGPAAGSGLGSNGLLHEQALALLNVG